MSLMTGTGRRIKLALVGTLVGAASLAAPVTAAHAIDMGALIDPRGSLTGPGRPCANQNAPGVYLYSDNTYRGKCGYWEFSQGFYNEDTIRANVGNDKALSMRIVGGGHFVMLYKHNTYRVNVANYVQFVSDIPDFKAYKFEDGSSLNDNVSSLYIS